MVISMVALEYIACHVNRVATQRALSDMLIEQRSLVACEVALMGREVSVDKHVVVIVKRHAEGVASIERELSNDTCADINTSITIESYIGAA